MRLGAAKFHKTRRGSLGNYGPSHSPGQSRPSGKIANLLSMNPSSARAWQEQVTIPTYGVGKPDRNPMFLEKRVYQGSSGAVYPFPVIDKIDDEKRDQQWEAIYLENQYLKIMILPQLGGRVQMALDKTND